MGIQDVIVKILEENGIEVDDKANLLNIDSMGFISAIVGIEQEFEIEFPDEFLEFGKFDTIKDFVRVVTYIIDKKWVDFYQ